SKIHIFSFSERRGTPAAEFTDMVPPPVIAERRQRLVEVDRELRTAYYRSLIGRRLDVLIEGPHPRQEGYVMGTSCRYAPVAVPGTLPALLSRRVPVRAMALADGVVFAHPEPESGMEAPSAPVAGSEGSFHHRFPLL